MGATTGASPSSYRELMPSDGAPPAVWPRRAGVIQRTAARVLLVDDRERLLLCCMRDPAQPELGAAWFTPGGGLDPGETVEQAAVREVREETGLRLAPQVLGPCVWRGRAVFSFAGLSFDSDEHFHLARVPAFDVDSRGYDAWERAGDMGHRWWSVVELVETTERIYPVGLARLLPRVLAGRWDGPPLRLDTEPDGSPP